MTAPVDQPSEALGPAAELVINCECAADGLQAPAAAPGAPAFDVGFVSRVGAIGGFAIQRVEIVVVAVDDVTVVALVVEIRIFRADRSAPSSPPSSSRFACCGLAKRSAVSSSSS